MACLTHIQEILAAYDRAPAVLAREGIDDGAVDPWSPLVATILVGDAEDGAERIRPLLDLARDLGSARDADAEGGTTVRLLEAVRAEVGDMPSPAKALRGRPWWEWVGSPRRLAGFLNPLGIGRRQLREGDRRRWCYVLPTEQLADLGARYGVASDTRDEAEDTASPTFFASVTRSLSLRAHHEADPRGRQIPWEEGPGDTAYIPEPEGTLP